MRQEHYLDALNSLCNLFQWFHPLQLLNRWRCYLLSIFRLSIRFMQVAETSPVKLSLKNSRKAWVERAGTCTSRDHAVSRPKAQPRKLRKHVSLSWGNHCQGYNQERAPVENIGQLSLQYPYTYKNPASPLGLNITYSFTTLTCELSTKLQFDTNID